MKIIVLSGGNSTGKTTTLNVVYDTILILGGISTNKQKLGGGAKDFSDVVDWLGKRIAFFTMGDYSSYLIKGAEDYSQQHIDVLICACNTRFVRPNPLSVFAQMGRCHVIVKTFESNQLMRDLVNRLDSQTIISHI